MAKKKVKVNCRVARIARDVDLKMESGTLRLSRGTVVTVAGEDGDQTLVVVSGRAGLVPPDAVADEL